MSVSTALGLVSASLRNLLIGEMQLTPSVPVTILAPMSLEAINASTCFSTRLRRTRS